MNRHLRTGTLLLLSLVFLPLAGGASPSAADSRPAGLHILLTNDDGIDALGIRTLKDALVAAGHRIVVVAPDGNRSGSSASMTFGAVPVVKRGEDEHAADATPASCVLLGLTAFADPEDPFDLVVSGTNFGANAGAATGISGTVGATTAALMGGMPAVAFSANPLDRDEKAPVNAKHFAEVAAEAVKILGALVASAPKDGPFLEPGTALNVNFPARPVADVLGLQLSVQGQGMQFSFGFEEKTPGIYVPAFRAPDREAEDVLGSDAAALAAGYATVVVRDADYTAPPAAVAGMRERLGSLLE